jgi:hypothetical protein
VASQNPFFLLGFGYADTFQFFDNSLPEKIIVKGYSGRLGLSKIKVTGEVLNAFFRAMSKSF